MTIRDQAPFPGMRVRERHVLLWQDLISILLDALSPFAAQSYNGAVPVKPTSGPTRLIVSALGKGTDAPASSVDGSPAWRLSLCNGCVRPVALSSPCPPALANAHHLRYSLYLHVCIKDIPCLCLDRWERCQLPRPKLIEHLGSPLREV
jgi:hypothetical protein